MDYFFLNPCHRPGQVFTVDIAFNSHAGNMYYHQNQREVGKKLMHFFPQFSLSESIAASGPAAWSAPYTANPVITVAIN